MLIKLFILYNGTVYIRKKTYRSALNCKKALFLFQEFRIVRKWHWNNLISKLLIKSFIDFFGNGFCLFIGSVKNVDPICSLSGA